MADIKIFLSCPQDIVEEGNIINIVERIIQEVNFYYKSFDIKFDLTYWKKSPSIGKGEPRVQDRINNRLVKNCDIFLGILWTKIGSPPGINTEGISYSSGTEEEFYLASGLNKDLWMLFCSYSVDISIIDAKLVEQLEKVRDFKKHLKEEGILYAEFSSEKEFRDLLKETITEWLSERYFIKNIEQEEREEVLPMKSDFEKHNRGF